MTHPTNRLRICCFSLALAATAPTLTGCANDQMTATNQLVQQQQQQIEQMAEELAAIKANQNPGYTPGVASHTGGCDKAVEATATQRGGEKFAASEFGKALGYYQDAAIACPGDAKAEVNIARAYEAMGNRVSAIKHYRKAADAQGAVVTDAQDQARAALIRLQADRLP